MTDQTTAPDKSDQTAEDVAKSLTGYDEIAITQEFGTDAGVLLAQEGSTTARALIFIVRKRQLEGDGVKGATKEAKRYAMGMRLGEVMEYFPDVDSDEEPSTPAGEGDSQPA